MRAFVFLTAVLLASSGRAFAQQAAATGDARGRFANTVAYGTAQSKYGGYMLSEAGFRLNNCAKDLGDALHLMEDAVGGRRAALDAPSPRATDDGDYLPLLDEAEKKLKAAGAAYGRSREAFEQARTARDAANEAIPAAQRAAAEKTRLAFLGNDVAWWQPEQDKWKAGGLLDRFASDLKTLRSLADRLKSVGTAGVAGDGTRPELEAIDARLIEARASMVEGLKQARSGPIMHFDENEAAVMVGDIENARRAMSGR